MIEGIQILDQFTVTSAFLALAQLAIMGFIITAILFVLATLFKEEDFSRDLAGGGIFALLLSGIFLVIFLLGNTPDYTAYKVTISDNVNFMEFHDRYEILTQEGKIYTIKDRAK